uniref:Uncharacterized protein n=1 Tax=Aegilops tauschii subsp. strangulata TaxID=200361 RepID=A0A453KXA5_AEGTS
PNQPKLCTFASVPAVKQNLEHRRGVERNPQIASPPPPTPAGILLRSRLPQSTSFFPTPSEISLSLRELVRGRRLRARGRRRSQSIRGDRRS